MTIPQLEALITGRTDNGGNKVVTERVLWRAIRNEAIKLYEVKEIDVNLTTTPTYLTDNFDNTGLGINGMVGFAICNGNNGTRNRAGKVSVGYGPGFATIGANGGYADSTLVEHSHKFSQHQLDQEVSTNGSGVKSINKNGTQFGEYDTTIVGTSGVGKNYPPYIVTLKIQRIN